LGAGRPLAVRFSIRWSVAILVHRPLEHGCNIIERVQVNNRRLVLYLTLVCWYLRVLCSHYCTPTISFLSSKKGIAFNFLSNRTSIQFVSIANHGRR
jgi:hypothetical protein